MWKTEVMMRRWTIRAAVITAVFIPLNAMALERARSDEPITTRTLIAEMIDLPRLAAMPDPFFRTIQFSSYDRRSDTPGGPGWFSNSDGFGREPVPNFEAVITEPNEQGVGEYLICDVEGPGAIVRCWTAAIEGTIRVTLDEADTPLYDGPAADFLRHPFNVFAGQVGVDPAIFDGTFNQQNATYCPIPFRERCRIVWIGDVQTIHFYEVQVRKYESDANVVTFSPNDLREAVDEIRRVGRTLAHPGASFDMNDGATARRTLRADLAPGAAQDLLVATEGPGAVGELMMRVRAPDLNRALRQTVLTINFDGSPHAQVESPLGDFFGAAPGINPFDAVPFTVAPDGMMTCRFFMPFAKSVRLRVENRGEAPVSITGLARVVPYAWNDETSMHFHARWRVDHDLIGDPGAPQDLPFVIARGEGRYVGTASILMNPTDVPTPGGGWWGEGDEKIFVDDDRRPSTYGTGSEDYYNYAWSIPDIFGWAYCGQPRNDGPGNRGFVANHRWHILDSLPFEKSIAFFMELWPHRLTPDFSYARLSYYYARPGLIDDHVPISNDDVRPPRLPARWRPRAEGGARNSIFIEARDALVEPVVAPRFEFRHDDLYADGDLLRWLPRDDDETINFTFTIEEEGSYHVGLCALRSGDAGRIRLWVDDYTGDEQTVIVDLAMPHRHALRRIPGPVVALRPGTHGLRIQYLDDPGKTVGIDFLWIQKR